MTPVPPPTDLPGASAAPGDTQWWPAPTSRGPLSAHVQVPGSKSETNRALLLAATADTPGRVRGALDSRDTRLMTEALEALGADFSREAPTGDLLVTPLERPRGGATLNCGLAGTVLRFLPPLAALAEGTTTFIGDEAAQVRPVRPVLAALETWGARVTSLGEPGFLPFQVSGAGALPLPGAPREVEVDASASSQFVSALLLSAPLMDGPVTVRARGRVVSLPHVAMTVAALRARGVRVDTLLDEGGASHSWTVSPGRPRGGEVTIDPDLSNAGPFLAAALVCGGTVRVAHWPTHTTQAGDAWRHLLPRMGADVVLDEGGLRVDGPGREGLLGIDADLSDVGELTPTVAALAVLATTPSRITGIAHLRGHETDRLAALATEITRLGGQVRELPDGLEIHPVPLHAARLRTYGDHRMATFAAVVGLAVPGVEVQDVATTSKTLPGFTRLWTSMLSGGDRGRGGTGDPGGTRGTGRTGKRP